MANLNIYEILQMVEKAVTVSEKKEIFINDKYYIPFENPH